VRAAVIGCAVFLGLVAQGGAAEPARAILDKIDAAAKDTRTLSAEFTQKNRMKLFRKELSSKGRLYFRGPRQIRWEYLAPDPSLLVLDGNRATMTSPGAAPQVFDLDKDTTMRAIFDQLLTFVGGGSLASAEIAYAIDASGTPDAPVLQLTPKAGAPAEKAFQKITLTFDAKAQVKRISLVEKNGDEKEISFSKVERNGKLPEKAFAP
jgi:outer membrane lipoprotein carrier protein